MMVYGIGNSETPRAAGLQAGHSTPSTAPYAKFMAYRNPLKAKPIYSVVKRFQQKLSQSRRARDRGSNAAVKAGSRSFDFFKPRRPVAKDRILILGKNKKYREELSTLLQKKYQTLESTSGEDALCRAREAQPALIITGPCVPKHEVLQLLRKLKSNTSLWYIPVLLLVSRNATWGASVINDTDQYIKVPVLPRKLLVSINRMLNKRKRARAFTASRNPVEAA